MADLAPLLAGLFLRSSAQRATNSAARRWGGGLAASPNAGKPSKHVDH